MKSNSNLTDPIHEDPSNPRRGAGARREPASRRLRTLRDPVRFALLVCWLPLVGAGCLEFQQGPVQYPEKPFGYLEVEGLRVHYRELVPPAGVEPAGTIVLLHGFGGALVSWFYCQPALAARYRTVAIDLKGFGLTDKPAGDYSIEAEARLVAGVMDRLQISRAHLIAHSWGSSVALALAHRHPERVERLVLVSGFVYEEQLNSFMRWARLPGLGEVLFGLFYDQQLEARYTWGFYEPERFVKAAHLDYLEEFQATPGITAAALAVVRGMDLAQLQTAYPSIRQPALLIWGRSDRVSPVQYGQRLATDLPRARLVTLSRAGHMAMLERSGSFTTLVLEFLGT